MTVELATIDTLVQAFQDHKIDLNKRLCDIENLKNQTLQSCRGEVENINNNNEEKKIMTKRLANRPAVSMSSRHSDHEDKNSDFINYIRKGESHALDVKRLSTQEDTDGGYLVPHAINYQLGKNLEKLSSLRQLASVTQISTGALDLLIDKEGAEVGWVGENDERDETRVAKLTKLMIPVHEMYAKPRATQRLLDDSAVNLENWIAETVAHKMAVIENKAFLTGDGNKKPRGILSYETSENYEWGKIQHLRSAEANSITIDDLIILQALLKTEYLAEASWIMSRQTASHIRRIKNNDENFVWQSSIIEGQPDRLLGHPVNVYDEMPEILTTASNIAVLFGDFKSGYQIVDRQGVYTLRDPYSAKPYVEFYTTKRVGGDVINFEAIKALKVKNA